MKKIKLKAPAKLNLTLEVIGRLPNGFHKLRSVMVKSNNIFDEIEIIFNEKKEGIEIGCDAKNIPVDDRNIVWKIAEKFFEKTGKKIGLKIKIKKRIPAAAGLGGGSSDGAAVLMALNDYFGKPLNLGELIALAAEVGKDIPFFLQKENLVYVSGMGEELKLIKNFSLPVFLIVKPEGEISTPEAYRELDEALLFMNDSRRRDISTEFLRNKKDVCCWVNFLYNDFEIVAKNKYATVDILEKALISFGALGASMTGKGPTVFGIFESMEKASEAKIKIKKYFPECFVAIG